MYPKNEPLPRYTKEFSKLGKATQKAILAVQKKYKSYWWNPHCKVTCTTHKKIHKFSFEAYTMGTAVGYFGCDSVKKMQEWLRE